MPILREGLLLKNKLLFEQTEKPYYCSLCYGSWSPYIQSPEAIFSSESLVTRFIPTITTGWNTPAGQDFVNIEFNFNYPDDVIFNRLIVYYGGLQRSKYDVFFTGFNSLTIASPELNDFSIGDRVLIGSFFYEVSSVSGFNLGLIPFLNSPLLPTTGNGVLIDASGIPLVATVLDDVYKINNNTNINFLINGTSG